MNLTLHDFAGAWTRTQLFEPKGHLTHHEDPTVRLVLWLQTSCGVFVDIRVDLPDVSVSTSKSFAGLVVFDPSVSLITWTRVIDYRPLSPPDIGKVSFISENVLQEDGWLEGDDFTEIWEREGPVEHCVAVELVESGAAPARRGYFVVVGDWFALTVCREISMPPDITMETLSSSFDKPIESDTVRECMLRHVTVAGRWSEDWTIVHALDPTMVGTSLVRSDSPALQSIFASFDWVVVEGSIPQDVQDRLAKARFDVNSEETIGSKWWLGSDIFMERAVQHTYAPLDLSWTASPVLIRLECTPFGRGASRQAYRLKYLSAPSEGGGLGSEEDWERAAEHVVKSYNTDDGSIKGEEDGLALDHVRLQHEAAFWAPAFNAARRRALAAEEAAAVPVNVIPCTVLQLTARPSHPVVSCEQYFSGTTSGSSADFVIHGSDTMHTGPAASNPDPLAFFLFTFYASGGLSMVVHMEGVENTFTNPQVHSYDCRFGHTDFGRRGMAMFLVGDHWNPLCATMGLPRFPLSMREKERAEKAKARAVRLSKKKAGAIKSVSAAYAVSRSDALSLQKKLASNASISSLYRGSSNEDLFKEGLGAELKKVSSFGSFKSFEDTQDVTTPVVEPLSADEMQEIAEALGRSKEYAGRVVRGAYLRTGGDDAEAVLFTDYFQIEEGLFLNLTDGAIVGCPSSPAFPEEACCPTALADRQQRLQRGAAEVHLELALLEAYGRFSSSSVVRFGSSSQCAGTGGQPDVASCYFHLAEACRQGSCAAALALGRLHSGLGSAVSAILSGYISTDKFAALDYFMLAAHRGSVAGLFKAAEIWESMGEIENAIVLFRIYLQTKTSASASGAVDEDIEKQASILFGVGDSADVDWGGCWYQAEVLAVMEDPDVSYRIKFTDGGEEMVVDPSCIRPLAGAEVTGESEGGKDVCEANGSVEKLISNEEEFGLAGGLVTPLYRDAIGSDGLDEMSVAEALGELGRLYARLHDVRESFDFRYINIHATEDELEDEDIYSWSFAKVFDTCTSSVPHNLYHCAAGGAGVGRKCGSENVMLLSAAAKYYNAAFETAMELGLRQAADKFIVEANKIERHCC